MKPADLCRAAACLAACLLGVPAWAAVAERVGDRLGGLSLEELAQLEITSVSKRAERLSDAPMAVFVITAADIRRSGATSLVEALRLAPNLHVAGSSAGEYSVTARGFASGSANKMLVLIDGRSVYTPLFSGVFWDAQDVMLEDVQRIEVISGPGSTLWGVNAVNGVINVITRPASDTASGLASVGVGTQESRGVLRFGGSLAGEGHYRVYATHHERRAGETQAGTRVDDAGRLTQAGFRSDWQRGRDSFTLKGDVYEGRHGQPLPGTVAISGVAFVLGAIPVTGANLIGAWQHPLADGGTLALQTTYDRTHRTVPPTFTDTQHTLDVQMQHTLATRGAHQPVWGLQYREGRDRVSNSALFAFLPERLNQTWLSVFAQDEVTLKPGLQLTLGARAERNDYTGTEFLPTARLAWKPAPQHLGWAALSRTVRAPSRLDHDTYVGPPPYVLRGGPEVRAETARVLELGYRGQVADNATLSATLFHGRYDGLRTQEADPSSTYYVFANGMRGRVSGFELWGSLQARPGWRLHGGFTRLHDPLELKPGSNDSAAVAAAEGANPRRWWVLRSALDVGASGEFDLTLRYVDSLAQPEVPRYHALDLRYGWRVTPDVECSVVGRNLLGPGHGEFADVATRTYFQPALWLKFEARF